MADSIYGMDSGYIPPPRTECIRNCAYESRTGENCSYTWEKGDYQQYVGEFLQGNMHGYGKYVKLNGSKSCMYEGSLYANNFEGYSNVVYMNGDYFEGLFKCNKRFGPGVYTYGDGSQSVGLWYGTQLIRLSSTVMSEWVPKLARSTTAKLKLLKYRKLVPIRRECKDAAKDALIRLNAPPELIAMSDKLYNPLMRNPNSLFFNRRLYDMKFFGELDCTIDVVDSNMGPVTLSSTRSSLTSVDNPNYTSKEFIQGILDYLIENVSIVEDFPEAERRSFMYESILEVRKRCQLEHDTAVVNSLLDDFMDDLDNILSKPSDERTLVINKRVVQKLLPQDQKGKMDLNLKKILVTDLLAWNNEEMYIDMLKHVFAHRNKETTVSFSIAKLLSGDREKFNVTGELERNCALFLHCCSVENVNEAVKIFYEKGLNPDVCDARGNTGIIFAASRDMWKIIKLLCDLGANLDAVNDECLTALTICLLRYIALQNDIGDWERAFIPDAVVTYEEELQTKQWHPHVSLTNLNLLNNLASSEPYTSPDETNINDDNDDFKIGAALKAMTDENSDIKCNSDIYEEFRKIEIDMVFKHFQEPYLENVDLKQNYVFGIKCLPPLKNIVSKFSHPTKKRDRSKSPDKSSKNVEVVNVKKTKKIEDERISFAQTNKLNTVLTTIRVLLNCGADPNLSNVPLPALMLAVFCNDLELFELLLKSGASPDIRTQDEGLSALHMLCSLPFTKTNLDRLKILLNMGADANVRTNIYHWMQEKEKLLGRRDPSEEDVGKTPLHILSMRYDYTNNEEIQTEMVELLINSGANLHDTYLGHEPFTLAILRGNLELVKYYLASGLVDPYRKLGEDMGVATTILVLKRYANVLPLENCKAVYEVFVEKNVNPLVVIEGNGNAVEYMETEYLVEKSQKSVATSKKQKSAKSRPRSKSPKSNKTSRQCKSSVDGVKKYLLECTKHMLQRYIQHQAYKYLKRFIMQNTDPENEITTTLIKFLPTKDLINQMQLLIHKGSIEPKPSNFYVALKMLEMSKKFTEVKDKKGKFNDLFNLPSEAIIKKFDWIQRPSIVHFNMIEPELDTEIEKYKVCFYCLKKIDKELIVCPMCGLVFFCCQECNRLSNRESTVHKCNLLFFDKQKAAQEYALQNGLEFEASALDKEIQRLDKIFKEKFGSMLKDMGIPSDIDLSQLNSTIFENVFENDSDFLKLVNTELDEHNLSGLDEDIKQQHYNLLEAKRKRDEGGSITDISTEAEQRKTDKGGKSIRSGSKGSVGYDEDIRGTKRDVMKDKGSSQGTKKGSKDKKGARGSEKSSASSKSAKGAKGTKDAKGSRARKGGKDTKGAKHTQGRSKSKDSGTTKVETLYRRDKKYPKGDKSSKYAVYKHDISKSDYTRSMKGKYEQEQEKLREKYPGRAGLQDWLSGGRFGYAAGFGRMGKGFPGIGDEFNRLPRKCQFFMEGLSQLFPDIDFSLLFWPYVCYVDGQLYYRFLEERPVFLETYSSI